MTSRYVLEQCGVGIAAITGVMAARGKQVDLFGVIVLALVTAFGGGTIRDVAIGDHPVFWAKDAHYVYTAAGAAIVTFFLARTHEIPLRSLQVADAFALALFTIVGLVKAYSFHVPPAIAVMLGVTTGVAGGILRDLLLNEIPLVFRPDIYLYATAAFAGAVLYVILRFMQIDPLTNMVVSVAAILLVRLAGIQWKLALPVFNPKDRSPGQT